MLPRDARIVRFDTLRPRGTLRLLLHFLAEGLGKSLQSTFRMEWFALSTMDKLFPSVVIL